MPTKQYFVSILLSLLASSCTSTKILAVAKRFDKFDLICRWIRKFNLGSMNVLILFKSNLYIGII